MRPILLAALLTAACSGCGAEEPGHLSSDLDPGLVPVISEVMAALESRGLTPQPLRYAGWATLDEPMVGMCDYQLRAIWLHPRLALSPVGLRAVVAHELGHCVLGLGHDREPGHLLSPNVPTDVLAWSPARWADEYDRLVALARRHGTEGEGERP